MTNTPWFYPDKVSAAAGERVALFASSPQTPCTLTVTRIGSEAQQVARFEGIEIGQHSTPENADQNGCGWPEVFQFTVGEDWASGYYDLVLEAPDGGRSHHFVCVRKATSARKADAVLVLATNTYMAYNYWGGSNSYADVEGLPAGRLSPDESRPGAIGRLSRMRPYPQSLIAPPAGAPRLINMVPRGVGEMAFPGDLEWAQTRRPSPYDGSACFLQKWENVFAAWADEQGYEIDYLTDHDFEDTGTDWLSGYKTVLIVGHSEYWSGKQRTAIDAFTERGGNLAIFSGNTCYWKIRWEDDGQTMVAHKWRGHLDDPLWEDPNTRSDATHLWSHDAFDAPEADLIGLSFIYGGYHRIAMCASRGAAGFTIYDDQHWALAGTDLYYGDVLGTRVPLIGYENDGCPIRFGPDGLPKPDGGLGVPQNLQIIGIAPATLAESDRSPYPKMIPQEESEIRARMAYGSDDPETIDRLMRGHSVLASFKRGEGEVFNSGTTEWVHGLGAKDPFVEQITHNVLERFGMQREATSQDAGEIS